MYNPDSIKLPKGATLIEDQEQPTIKLPKGATLITEEPIKKKVGTIPSKVGGQVGTSVLPLDEEDPVKTILEPQREQVKLKGSVFFNQPQVSEQHGLRAPIPQTIEEAKQLKKPVTTPKQEFNAAANNLVQTHDAIKSNAFKSKTVAEDYLKHKQSKYGQVDLSNETNRIAKERVDEYNKVYDDYQKTHSIVGSAVNEAIEQDPHLAEQFKALKGNLPPALLGSITANYILKHKNDLEDISKNDRSIGTDYEDVRDNIEKKFPEYGRTVIANFISQEREKRKYNSAIANFNTETFRKHNDEIAEKLPKNLKELWDKDKEAVTQQIDTGGFFNRLAEGEEHTLSGMAGTVKALTGQTSTEDAIRDSLNEQATAVNSGEKGWKQSIGQMGHFTGVILPIIAGSNILEGAGMAAGTASKVSTGAAFLDDLTREANVKFPNDKDKATLSAGINMLAYTMLPDIVPANKIKSVFDKIKSETGKAIEDVGENATAQEVRNKIVDAIHEGTKQYIKGIGEMGGVTALNDKVDEALGLKGFHKDTEVGDVMKQMAVANIIPGVISGAGELFRGKTKPEEIPQPEPENAKEEQPSLVEQAKSAANEVPEMYRQPFLDNPEQSLKEISEQLHDPKSAETTMKTFGDKISDIALQLNPKEEPVATTPKETVNETKPKVRVTAEQLEVAQPREPITPIEPSEAGEGKLTGITHEETQRTREEFGLGNEYEKKRKTDEELYDKAENEIKKGYDINGLISGIEGGKHPNDTETTILKIYKANLEAKIEKDPSDKNLSELLRLVKATDVIGSEQGRAFRARQGGELRDDSFASFFIDESTANNDVPLTASQKETAKTGFNRLKAAKEEANDAEAKLQEVASKEAADQEVKKTAKSTKRTKKTHEDFVKERKDILESAREALRKARGETSATILPYAKELVAIAPHVAKMVKSLAEEGVIKLEEVVKTIHNHFKDDIKDLKEKDIHDIIAGEYNERKRGTKREALITAENLRIEAQLINKLEKLEKGEIPKNAKAEVRRTHEIDELRKKIAEKRRENPDYEGKLKQLTERNKKETERIRDKIENAEYEPEAKAIPLLQQKQLQKQFPKEFLKAQRSQDALIKVRNEIAIRRLKQMYENKSPQEKTMEIFAKTLNVPRTMMASFDFSAPLRQGIVASTAHPIMASKALRFMFEAAKDEKVYNRWLDVVHNSERWNAAQKTDLGITDPASLHLKEREEAFQGAPYAEKIPIIGLGIKASERAYIGYLNHLRWNLFNMYADRFEAMGKTYENNPDLYKGISSFINSSTGRGNLEGKLNNAAPLLNSFLFASKLMASRINMLGLSDIPNLVVRGATLGKRGLDYGFYTKLPKEIRVEALKDMAKFVGVGVSILLAAKMMGANVEDDPRSSDFGKIHVGNTRWDIWGGFQPYARVLTQFITGERKATTTGDIQELNGKGFMGQTRATPLTSFFRTKLAPVPGTAWNLIEGSDVVGNKVTPQGELLKSITPLLGQDIYQAMQDQGVKAIFTVGIPSAFGVGVQTFQPKVGQGGGKSGGAGASGKFRKSTKSHKQQKHN